MAMTHKLSQIENWRSCNVQPPAGYEVEAVVEWITDGWAPECDEDTATLGVAPEDQKSIRDLIDAHKLSCTPEECCRALWAHCKRQMLGD